MTARTGYTLPVFACASAVAALRWLKEELTSLKSVSIDLLDPAETVEIPIEQVARLADNCQAAAGEIRQSSLRRALAISRSDPGDNLDLTRYTPVWAEVVLYPATSPAMTEPPQISLRGGEGIGQNLNAAGQPAIYAYARRLLSANLMPWLKPGERLSVNLILPEGRALAERTSNAAFGIVEGLSLLGTSGISQPLSAPEQLATCRAALQQKAGQFDCVVFCIGENGLALAQSLGINPEQVLKTANWIGPLLVEAAILEMPSVLLFGYHGKLLKLAAGIFHTHHHVADARREILIAYAAMAGLPAPWLSTLWNAATAEAALHHLRHWQAITGEPWVDKVYQTIAQAIDERAQTYAYTHSHWDSPQRLRVGSVLFDRDRQLVVSSATGQALLAAIV
ncbi:cobalt-precorrin-5B (C(1))-methyltransferase CbiD [Trichothermofontia sichuanensis B231]|uniref:cobalt-precorrin-5B (C(1))-methyltransferase CbiD n=1 Tax=Trichothermofontia sichuanensis TaxID=3045816 RepID=UPI0022462457|nr:cobalt-precorrin-5B (C(1))-methyltransferase CbiD [Trichothermofontia sichuanensis]UZQ55464.1 cobalt-precorrin-5B (C(1))-methyltransferase CbiD [Trichothermofontia sichuanensis B231]